MNIRTVLCPVDFTAVSRAELALAAETATHFQARVILAHNCDPLPAGGMAVSWMWRGEHAGEKAAPEAEAHLQRLLAVLPASLRPEARLTRGPVAETLLQLARELPADLMVMGSHGWSGPRHRSVTEDVVLRAPCPVLTLSADAPPAAPLATGEGNEVALLAVEMTTRGRHTLAFGLELCAGLGLKPVVLHVHKGRRGRTLEKRLLRLRESLVAELPARWRGKVECLAIPGPPAQTILETASQFQASCLVLGVHDRLSLARLGGHTLSREILHTSPRPVWFIPGTARLQPAAGAAA